MKRIAVLIILPLLCVSLFAQERLVSTDEKAVVPSLLFKRFYTANGLPDERIRSLYQDSKGFLWIGTMNGISRYDGYTFKNFYSTQVKNSIVGNWAYDITEDASHNIWIATNEGLSKFDQQKETFLNYKLPHSTTVHQSDRINTLHFDTHGMLWLGSKNGLLQFNPQNGSFKTINSYPLNQNISKLITSGNEFIWVATDAGIVHFNTQSFKYDTYKIDVKPSPYGDRVWSLLEHQKDLLIATASEGLLLLPYDGRTNAYGTIRSFNNFSSSNESDRKSVV